MSDSDSKCDHLNLTAPLSSSLLYLESTAQYISGCHYRVCILQHHHPGSTDFNVANPLLLLRISAIDGSLVVKKSH